MLLQTDAEIGLNPLSMHFGQIKVSDLILVDEEGTVVEGDEPINAAAFAIHSVRPMSNPTDDVAWFYLRI